MQFSEHLTRPQLQSGSVIDVMCKLLVCWPVYFSRRQPVVNLSNIPVLLNSGRCWNVLLLNILMFILHNQRRIQNFPEGRQLQKGEATYCLAKFCRKLHENGIRDVLLPIMVYCRSSTFQRPLHAREGGLWMTYFSIFSRCITYHSVAVETWHIIM